MPEAQRHTIRRQFLEVVIDGEEREGAALHRALPEFCARVLTPAIGQVLDRYVPREGVLTIERLELDAGNVKMDELSEKLPRLVADALEKELNKIPDGNGANFLTDNARLRTVPETLIEAFLFFLENGTLPWSFSNAPGSGLEREIALALKEASPNGSLPAKIKTALFEALRSTVARQRLVRQFSPAFIRSIPELFAAGEQQLLDSLLGERGKERAVNLAGHPERQLVEEALALIVSGISLTKTTLLAALPKASATTGEPKAGAETAVGKTRSENPLSPELTHTGKRPTDMPHEQAVSQPDTSTDSEVSGQRETPAGSTERHGNSSASPDNAPEIGSERPHAATGDTTVTSSDAPSTQPLSDTEELRHHHDHKASGERNASAKSATDNKLRTPGRSPDHQNDHQLLPESASENSGEEHPAGSGDKAVTHAQSALTELHGRHSPEPESRRHDSSSGAEQEWPYGKRESAQSRKTFAVPEHPDKMSGLYIEHAGLVLLQPFLPQFFSGLGIVDNNTLLMPNRALCLLHFLATGVWSAPEYELPVMKILCGLPLEFVAETEEPLRPEEHEESAALLSAVIRHWDALKNSSPDGLREAFLKRPGKLSFSSGEWWLQVESNSFDILLDRLPWGFSMIRLPWMPSMLHVEWRF